MTALSVSLEPAQELFVDEQVQAGVYPDAAAVIRAGLERLRSAHDDEARKEARFRALVQEGAEDFEAGRFERVDDVEGWLAERGRRPAA